MKERRHILNILVKTKSALDKKDYVKIKNLSDQVIHHASIHQDGDVISVAVLIYALSKIIERENYKAEKNWAEFYSGFRKNIMDMIVALKNKNEKKFRNEVENNRKLIGGLSGKLKIYIGDVFNRAKINKASRIYEHGISIEKTAKMLGISLWEQSEYSGQTGIGNVSLSVTMNLNDRIKIVEEIFKKWRNT